MDAWAGVVVTNLMALWSKPDKRFDDLEAEIQEGRAETRALRKALLPVKACPPCKPKWPPWAWPWWVHTLRE